ncbi:stage III sporulation protein AF [Risungbinella massiliensis]|uniref:stage III sporulation protein AF n=1 Tax=Risungbinella massiliensis TaxID=1329796 RepID=UPI00069C2AF0|nr:stage III sporulation protein AF [Risungbinella massiliensis]
MDWLADWLKELILLVLVATFLDLLLPSNSMERYVKLVMGLLLIMAILHPVFQLINHNIDLKNLTIAPEVVQETSKMPSMEQIRQDGEKLQQTQADFIRKQMEQSVESWAKETLEQKFAVEVVDVQATASLNEQQVPVLQEIILTVQRKDGTSEENQMQLRPVDPITIGEEESQPATSIVETKETGEMQSYLLDYWEIDPEKVRIEWKPSA